MTRSVPARALLVNTVELLRQPGNFRELVVELTAADLGIDDEHVAGPISSELRLDATVDGITVSGTVATPYANVCRRCLNAVRGVSVSEVDELYQQNVTDADAYQLDGDQLDLAPVVREYALIDLPEAPLCRDDCAGICPACGIDRNQSTCECDTTVRDDRWAALDELRLDDD